MIMFARGSGEHSTSRSITSMGQRRLSFSRMTIFFSIRGSAFTSTRSLGAQFTFSRKARVDRGLRSERGRCGSAVRRIRGAHFSLARRTLQPPGRKIRDRRRELGRTARLMGQSFHHRAAALRESHRDMGLGGGPLEHRPSGLGARGTRAGDFTGDESSDKHMRQPVIWGPSYASGAAIFGRIGKVEYAAEVKNTSLSSRPETWDATETQWQNPTFSGRLGFRPNEMWTFGVSASTGTYLRPEAEPTLAPGHSLDDYRQIVIAQDIGFAWRHFRFGRSFTKRASRYRPWAMSILSPITWRQNTKSRRSSLAPCVGTSSFSAPCVIARVIARVGPRRVADRSVRRLPLHRAHATKVAIQPPARGFRSARIRTHGRRAVYGALLARTLRSHPTPRAHQKRNSLVRSDVLAPFNFASAFHPRRHIYCSNVVA